MKTIIIHEGQKNTIQGECKPKEAMEILGLDPKEWKVTSKNITDKAATYTIERKCLALMPVTSGPQSKPLHFLAIVGEATLDLNVPKEPDQKAPVFKLNVDRGELQAVLPLITEMTKKKGALPILSTVKLISTADNLTLSATDLEKSFTVTIPSDGDPVALCVSADLFCREVKALDEKIEDVELTVTQGTIKINGRCQLPTSETDEFPEIAPIKGEQVSIETLGVTLKTVLPAVCRDETRYALTGVFFDFPKRKLAATDGFRLHVSPICFSEDVKVPGVTVPYHSASLLSRYGATAVTVSEKHLAASLMGGVFITHLISGEFPDYEAIWPDTQAYHNVMFKADEFIDLMPGVVPVSNQSAITITINGQIDIQAESESGTYAWHVPGKSDLTGKPVEFSVNSKYIVDAIKAYAPDEMVTLRFPKGYGALVINDKALVMPIRR